MKQLESAVASTGRGRGGGYYLSDRNVALATEATTRASDGAEVEWGRENCFIHHSYPG